MATPDQTRIERDRARPRIVALWFALRPLTSVVRFMQTGAHPDDEISGMLAALALRDGINLSYACSTRGEGGQNDVGTEAGAALGALRTREMERACDVLGMRMYWHSEAPGDAITDFGFSKSGDETLGIWGRDRTLARFVEIVRAERPDIICPTFLDVPGQHGHHRAMTETAHAVMAAAADPAFPSNRAPWQVKKMYLPAWSGAGQSYDDDEPPPAATLVIDGSGGDAVTGWSWDRIGQQSRAYHRTQGMGRWVPAGAAARDWPLHLSETHVPGPDTTLASGLNATLGDLAALPGAGAMSKPLAAAEAGVEEAVAAFPDFAEVANAAMRALVAVRTAQDICPDDLRDEVLHRLDAKDVQLAEVLRLALGVDLQARVEDIYLSPGESTAVGLDAFRGQADSIEAGFDLPEGWKISGDRLEIGQDARPSDPYPAVYDPAVPDAPAVVVTIRWGDEKVVLRQPFEDQPVILPKLQARITPGATLMNRSTGAGQVRAVVDGVRPDGPQHQFALPDGWRAEESDEAVTLVPPDLAEPGRYDLPLLVDGAPAQSVRRIRHDHAAPTALATPAVLSVLVADIEVPGVKVGYIGAGNDRVDHWLASLGADVTPLSDDVLASDALMAGFDTIVIGIFAMRFRAGLVQAMPRIHRWCEAGGTMVTLYHRPWDNWDPLETPPRRLEIGQPSLRWRVTDAAAEVRHLADHPVLRGPNPIGPDDWEGWVKERGLYFAKSWDAAYTPLVEMADPGEAPHQGALLVADAGAGRHVHTSLILHIQMENLVPGAFRLMANLIAKRSV